MGHPADTIEPERRTSRRARFLDQLERESLAERRPEIDAATAAAPPDPVFDERRLALVVEQLTRLRNARLLKPSFGVLCAGWDGEDALQAIGAAFPRAECLLAEWPASSTAGRPGRHRIYVDRLLQSWPPRKLTFEVVLMPCRFSLPGAEETPLSLVGQADSWLGKRSRYVFEVATADRRRELREQGMQVAALESGGRERLVCWTASAPLPQHTGLRRRVQPITSFSGWFGRNLRDFGAPDALAHAGRYLLARLDGRLTGLPDLPNLRTDQDLRTRFAATRTPRRPVRAGTAYVFVFLGEFGYELMNWQGVVRRFAQRLPASSSVVVAGRPGLQQFYETAAQYVEIGDLPEYRSSFAGAYFAMPPDQPRRSRPPTRAQLEFDRDLRKAIERHVRRELRVPERRVEFVFSSDFNGLGDCEFGVDPRFYGLDLYRGQIYRTLDARNNEYALIRPSEDVRAGIEATLGWGLDEPYVLVQGRTREIGPQAGGRLDAAAVVEALARHVRVVYLEFESGRYLDSGSTATFHGATAFRVSSFREQSCLIAHARHCVFFTEGDLGSHTYLPPLLGKDVTVVAAADVFAQRSAPLDFWNGAVFRFGGKLLPQPHEQLADPGALDAFAAGVADLASHARPPAEQTTPARRILFFLRHEGYVRNLEYVIDALAAQGHAIHLALGNRSRAAHDAHVLERLKATHPGISFEVLAPLTIRPWDDATALSRGVIDYLRYLEPLYADSPRLRARLERRVPEGVTRMSARLSLVRRPRLRRALKTLLRTVDHVAPPHFEAEELLRARRPDLAVFTPLLDGDPSTHDYLKTAKELGIPTALCVASWDNLSSKGIVQQTPDLVILWNDVQKDEAVGMHGIPPERIRVVGAHLFDHWFEMEPSCSREEFCRRRGLDPAQPFVLYVCSSGFIAQNEVPFVESWATRVRNADPPLRDVGILVRPHAAASKHWRDADLSHLGNIAVWPPLGEGPVEDEAKQHYFDSLHHCAAVVGINTSALLEGGILGKPVLSVLAPEYRETQLGTVHFHYLAEGGLLTLAPDLDEHVRQLGAALFGDEQGNDDARDSFVRDFIRPHGLDTPATPLAVDALTELLDRQPARPAGTVPGVEIARVASRPLAALVHRYLRRARRRLQPGGTGAGLINRDRDPRIRRKAKKKPAA